MTWLPDAAEFRSGNADCKEAAITT